MMAYRTSAPLVLFFFKPVEQRCTDLDIYYLNPDLGISYRHSFFGAHDKISPRVYTTNHVQYSKIYTQDL